MACHPVPGWAGVSVFSGDTVSRPRGRLGLALDDKTTTIVLDERDIPTHWYNVVRDLPSPPPPPLHPATGRPLGPALDTPAHIYYKYEGVSPAGSHKPNTAVAQAYYNKQEGTRRLTTETGPASGAPPSRSPAPWSTSTAPCPG